MAETVKYPFDLSTHVTGVASAAAVGLPLVLVGTGWVFWLGAVLSAIAALGLFPLIDMIRCRQGARFGNRKRGT